jgi:DNA ligase (NAD+)
MAPQSIPAGSDYGHEIPKAIEKCKAFLLLLSDASQNSNWVPKEVGLAIGKGKIVVPFQIDNATISEAFNFYLTNSPTRKVQGEVLPYLTKVQHSVPMLSADKSTDIEDVKKFIGDKEVVTSFKLDGSTVVVKYENGELIQGLSRGSGTDGEDITHTVKMIKNLPMTVPYKGYLEIRGEALIPWKYYNEMNIDGSLGHPRNVASGALRQLDASEAAKRNIYFYAFTLVNWREVGCLTKKESLRFLSDKGFDIVPYIVAPTQDSAIRASFALDRKVYENPTDGWCFEFNDLIYGEHLGSTGHHDRRLYALKPEIEEYETTLRDIEWTLGKTGQLTPTAIFDPTEIDNTIITKASVHNLSVMKNLRLKIGGKCFIHKANMIIPQVLRCVDGDSDIEIPKYCPVCGGKTEVVKENESEVLMCTNSQCSGKLLGRLKFFVSKPAVNIDGLSEATLEFLITERWVKKFQDIYHLEEHRYEWEQFDGFGAKSVDKILKSIKASRNITCANFITALSIDGVGKSAAKTISDYFNGDFYEFIEAFDSDFDWTILDDIGDKTAQNINRYLAENDVEICALAEEFEFIIPKKVEVKENPFSGKILCVTGKLNTFTRDSINAKISELGAKAASSVSSKTDYLITNEQSGSSKYKKAVELNIPIITENEFLEMIGD